MTFSYGGVPSERRQEGRLSQEKEKRRDITNDTAAVKISSHLEFPPYMCIRICKNKPPTQRKTHAHKHTHARKYTTIGKSTPVRSHTAQSLQSKMSEKAVRLPQRETRLFIYLREFRVITGITVALGCDIPL